MNPPSPLVCVVDDDASVRKSLVRLFRSEDDERLLQAVREAMAPSL